MSVERSIAKFIRDNITEFEGRVFVGQIEFEFRKKSIPFCLVSVLPGYFEETHHIGDEDRIVNSEYQIDVYTENYDDMVRLANDIKKKIMNNWEDDVWNIEGDKQGKGINLFSFLQKLSTTDRYIYDSGQIEWFLTPAPIIYRNGVVVDSSEYTIDFENGKIHFVEQQEEGSDIRATYKCGVVDFDDVSLVYIPPETAQERKIFAAYLTIRPVIYHKRIGQYLY